MIGIDVAGIMSPPEWMADAACATAGGDWWFGGGGSSGLAKRVCADCPVRAECLAYALAHDERFGIWGGTSGPERRRLTRSGGPVKHATVRERIAEISRLARSGLTDRQIAERIGCTGRTVQRIRSQAGIPAARPLRRVAAGGGS